jgi:hypothetical protein
MADGLGAQLLTYRSSRLVTLHARPRRCSVSSPMGSKNRADAGPSRTASRGCAGPKR